MDGLEIQTKLTMLFTILLASIQSQSDIFIYPPQAFLKLFLKVEPLDPDVRKQSGSKSGSPEAVRK